MIQTLLLFVFGYIILEMTLLITWADALGLFRPRAGARRRVRRGVAGPAQGLRSTLRMRSQMAAGAIPASEMTDGLLIAVAAVLLIIPGVLADIIGLALLFPPTRALIRRARGEVRQAWRDWAIYRRSGSGRAGAAPRGGDRIIDARVIETRVVEE